MNLKDVNASSKSRNKLMNQNPCLHCPHTTFQKSFLGNFNVKHALHVVTQHTYPFVKFSSITGNQKLQDRSKARIYIRAQIIGWFIF